MATTNHHYVIGLALQPITTVVMGLVQVATIKNPLSSAGSVFLGDDRVRVNGGYELERGEFISLELQFNEIVFAIAAQEAMANIYVTETGVLTGLPHPMARTYTL